MGTCKSLVDLKTFSFQSFAGSKTLTIPWWRWWQYPNSRNSFSIFKFYVQKIKHKILKIRKFWNCGSPSVTRFHENSHILETPARETPWPSPHSSLGSHWADECQGAQWPRTSVGEDDGTQKSFHRECFYVTGTRLSLITTSSPLVTVFDWEVVMVGESRWRWNLMSTSWKSSLILLFTGVMFL